MADKCFLDTDVLLDYLLNRKPFSNEATQLLLLAEQSIIRVYTTPSVILNCLYFGRKKLGAKESEIVIYRLLPLLHILQTAKEKIEQALLSEALDKEDAIQYFTALQLNDLDFFVTRNVSDYRGIERRQLPVLTPSQALTQLET